MWSRACWTAVLTSSVLLAYAGTASALTLGITSEPSSSGGFPCADAPGPVLFQYAQDPSTPYFAPSVGDITQWQTVTTGDTPGAAVTFAVLRPESSSYIVVGADTTTIPSPLPAGGVASYTLATPIPVQAGDTLAIYSTDAGVACYWGGTGVPTGDEVDGIVDSSPPPSVGQTLAGNGEPSPGGDTMNVAATFVQPQDAGVTTSAGPSGASVGQAAVLSSMVTNNGPGATPIAFADSVPSGLKIDSAVAADGACAVSGQTVTCTISGLSVGQTAPVDVVVTPSAAGSYANHVSVAPASGITDPNAANNTASATLTVGLSLPAKCVVPSLKGASAALAKSALKDLGCKVKTAKAHSKSVKKGSVVKTKPGKGSYAYQRTITLVVSSGPKKKK